MPLYELVCVAQHYVKQHVPLHSLLKSTASFVHENGGCVRRLDTWGARGLPQRIRKDGEWHELADYWTMQFDTNPLVVRQLDARLKADPRVLRWTTLKRGVTLSEVTAHPEGLTSKTQSYPSLVDYLQAGQNAITRPNTLHQSRADRERQNSA